MSYYCSLIEYGDDTLQVIFDQEKFKLVEKMKAFIPLPCPIEKYNKQRKSSNMS